MRRLTLTLALLMGCIELPTSPKVHADATADRVNSDTPASDTMMTDTMFVDTPDADVIAADRFVPDVVASDTTDVTDVIDVIDVIDVTDVTDVADATDVSDVSDAADVRDVIAIDMTTPDVPVSDVIDASTTDATDVVVTDIPVTDVPAVSDAGSCRPTDASAVAPGPVGHALIPDGGAPVIAAGSRHTCVIDDAGEVLCFGSNNDHTLGGTHDRSYAAPTRVRRTSTARVTTIAASNRMTCARDTSGTLECWGDGSPRFPTEWTSNVTEASVTRDIACVVRGAAVSCVDGRDVRTSPLGADAGPAPRNLSCGTDHCCALVGTSVYCWGGNNVGQISAACAGGACPTAVSVSVGGSAVSVSAGYYHSCAVVGSSVRCWGANNRGQLGNGTTADSSTPVIASVANATQVSAGQRHTCAITASGELYCWGDDTWGQLGAPPPGDRATQWLQRTPQAVRGFGTGAGLVRAVTVAAGETHTCVIDHEGRLWCFGRMDDGQLGPADAASPPRLSLASGVTHVATGDRHTCVVQAGAVRCAGHGQLGALGQDPPSRAWFDYAEQQEFERADFSYAIPSLTATSVAAGWAFSCAVTTHALATVQCWGFNESGALGSGALDMVRTTPADVLYMTGASLGNATSVSAGYRRACALTTAGPYCWGESSAERPLGVVATEGVSAAMIVRTADGTTPFRPVTSVATSRSAVCATTDGGVSCWGEGSAEAPLGTAGSGSVAWPSPVSVPSVAGGYFAAVTGWGHACAASSSSVLCWGRNDRRQVSNTGFAVTVPTAIDLPAGVTVRALAAGASHACAALSGGRVFCWGDNGFGQVSGVATSAASGPVAVLSGHGEITQLSLGAQQSCARTDAGALWCWGRAVDGALGYVPGDCRAADEGYTRPMYRSAPTPVAW